MVVVIGRCYCYCFVGLLLVVVVVVLLLFYRHGHEFAAADGGAVLCAVLLSGCVKYLLNLCAAPFFFCPSATH